MFLGLTFSILGFFLGYENLAILFLGGLISWWRLHIVAAKHKHLISNLLFVLYNLMLS